MNQIGMGTFGFLSIIVFIIQFAKEILLIFLMYKGIKVLNIYINKNRSQKKDDAKEINKRNLENEEEKRIQ
ncbi:hypothetical protein [Anaerosalibacter massiliensis]|uniref:Uncharacterized protein n=1 Tax=Anaerosalibacter massiliensis TaxID=1347392 RepID=A0A9X2MJJ3_9FIRM|nr:hypothetical protein [Anaerosalibacter massiliensis]MCR2045200.1 hypothetical protein [Anaerosalibacter massiliensis]